MTTAFTRVLVEVASLRLELTHSEGEIRGGSVCVPASGAGMADALRLCGARQSEPQWRDANLCRIGWCDAAGGWRLFNGAAGLVCTHEGHRVHTGAVATLCNDDVLELGLMRFRVAYTAAALVEPAPAAGLRELAGRDSGHRAQWSDDPFDIPGLVSPRSRPRTTADVLAELLGDVRPPARQTASPPPGVDFLADARTPARQIASPPPAAGHLGDARSPARQTASSLPAVGLLGELHTEFERVVRDPDQLAGRTDWEAFLAADGAVAPSLDALQAQAGRYPLLRDILQPRETIDRVIEGFDAATPSRLLDAVLPEEVLGLFALGLVPRGPARAPSLTLREHHDLSLDSHMVIGAALPDTRRHGDSP